MPNFPNKISLRLAVQPELCGKVNQRYFRSRPWLKQGAATISVKCFNSTVHETSENVKIEKQTFMIANNKFLFSLALFTLATHAETVSSDNNTLPPSGESNAGTQATSGSIPQAPAGNTAAPVVPVPSIVAPPPAQTQPIPETVPAVPVATSQPTQSEAVPAPSISQPQVTASSVPIATVPVESWPESSLIPANTVIVVNKTPINSAQSVAQTPTKLPKVVISHAAAGYGSIGGLLSSLSAMILVHL